jgi:hypothetical protein
MANDHKELIEYLNEKFSGIDQRFDEMAKDFNNLQIAVDGYAKKADTYFQEMAALAHKVNRHEQWLKQIAEKVGVKLEYSLFPYF